MFNPERLLGSLVNTALSQGLKGAGCLTRHGGVRSAAGTFLNQNKAAIGMGLLGIAIGAFEHFTQSSQASSQSSGNPSNAVAPMPQTPGAPPAVNWTPPPLPEQLPQPAASDVPQQVILLIRAMIASANADHAIDAQERQKILAKMEQHGLSAEERRFLEEEFAHPLELRSLAEQVKSPELAEQAYVVSLLAIEIDSEAERNYLRRLAKALNLSDAQVARWHEQLKPNL